jgi:DNA-binding Lrp family transcriptional regulator
MAVTSGISAAMDLIDQQLLSFLRQDARRSISDIAVSLGISRGTVRSRIERLERSGVIIGYAAVVNSEESGKNVKGIMMIDIEGQAAERVTRTLRGFAEVLAIHSTNGRWDLVVELATDTLGDFDAVLGRIRQIPGVAGSETSLLLATSRNIKTR